MERNRCNFVSRNETYERVKSPHLRIGNKVKIICRNLLIHSGGLYKNVCHTKC